MNNMINSDSLDSTFLQAVESIDNGDIMKLKELLASFPELASMRLDTPEEVGYFKDPYLLWFIADNPIRHEKLPDNILEITTTIIDSLISCNDVNIADIIDYTLGLVSTGRIPRECGVQIPLMELLITKGARVKGNVLGPIGEKNREAAGYLLSKGADYNLATAVGLDRMEDIKQLISVATASELYVALLVASFFGKADIIKLLIEVGADTNGQAIPGDIGGFHSHASPLHQAIFSGSFEAVKLLVEAGANINAKDMTFQATPKDWAIQIQKGDHNPEERMAYKRIENYLSAKL